MTRYRIAIDAMGADDGCVPLVAGAVRAAREYNYDLILCGEHDRLVRELRAHNLKEGDLNITIEHAADVIGMDEKPKDCIKRADTSMAVAARLVKDGKADAVFSAGNTGATLGISLLLLRRQKGINRPGLAALMPTKVPGTTTLLLDVGANVDCKPLNLVQFAVMGSIYMRDVMGCENPRIGVLSIGEEDSKGNEQVLETARLLRRAELNFVGNAEGRDVLQGEFDVIVCDGFVGNSLLKMAEGVVSVLGHELKHQLTRTWWRKLMALGLKPAFGDFKKRFDPAEFGGAPLLGLKYPVIVGHGSTSPRAVESAIRIAGDCVKNKVVEHIENEIKERHARTREGAPANLSPGRLMRKLWRDTGQQKVVAVAD